MPDYIQFSLINWKHIISLTTRNTKRQIYFQDIHPIMDEYGLRGLLANKKQAI